MQNIANYNLLTGNKWVLIIPFQKIDSSITSKTACFNLTNFSMPAATLSQTTASFLAHQIPIPGHTRNETRVLNFNYLLSSSWYQYKILYKWFSLISNEKGAAGVTRKAADGTSRYSLDINVVMLSEFKNPIFIFRYIGAFITELGGVELNYQSGENNILHNFSVSYAYYEFEDLTV